MKKTFAIAASFVFAAGCAVPTSEEAPSAAGGDHAEILSTGPWLEGSAASASSAGSVQTKDWGMKVGGNGGYYDNSFCTTIVGADGRAGDFLDSIQLLCSNGQNASSDLRWQGPWFGGGGGNNYNLTCPTGYVATGIQGGAGDYVDRLGFICRSASGAGYTTPTTGGGGGNSYWYECPWGQKVIGFGVRHGSMIDALQPYCGAR